MTTHRPKWIACDAIDHFNAAFAGVGEWCWADFLTKADAEQFALFCVLEGYGVYLSYFPSDRHRVRVNPDWKG